MASHVPVEKHSIEKFAQKITYIWKIENFSLCDLECGEFIKSSIFSSTEPETKSDWLLHFYPKGKHEKAVHPSLYIQLLSTFEKHLQIKYSFSILNKQNEKLFTTVPTEFVEVSEASDKLYGFNMFINTSIKEYLLDGKLILFCELNVDGCTKNHARVFFAKKLDEDWFSATRIEQRPEICLRQVYELRSHQNAGKTNSSIVLTDGGLSTEWAVQARKDSECFNIDLVLKNPPSQSLNIHYKARILNAANQVIGYAREANRCVKTNEPFQCCYGHFTVLSGETNGFKDAFTVECSVRFRNRILAPIRCVKTSVEILQHFRELFNAKEMCDVTFNVDGQQLRAHKTMLMARSIVFRAMFECDMTESSEGVVNIVDIDYETMEDVLRYIYTGQTLSVQRIAEKLLMAAAKYELHSLKRECELVLLMQISKENVVHLLQLAGLYDAPELKANALQFLISSTNSGGLLYRNLLAAKEDLAYDLFQSLLDEYF